MPVSQVHKVGDAKSLHSTTTLLDDHVSGSTASHFTAEGNRSAEGSADSRDSVGLTVQHQGDHFTHWHHGSHGS